GTRVLVEGGTVRDFGEAGAPAGTRVTVRRLFFNTPARRKFLKSSKTEWAHILREVVARSLVEPGTSLRLEHDGQEILALPAADSLRERVADLWGREGMEAMLEISGEAEGMAVRGWLESPASDSSPRRGLFLSVNGRPVHDRTVLSAVREAYGTRLAGKGLPSGCLEVSLDPLDVDVNIHPAKREVKFRRPPAVRGLVAESVAAALRGRSGVFSPGFPGGRTLFPEARPRPSADGIEERKQEEWSFAPAPGSAPAPAGPGAAPFRVIGVARDSYLLAETAEGLLAIDQHAAHERILFERFEDALGAGPAEAQQLLSPLRLDLEPAAAENLRAHLGLLREMGIEVEEFGGDSWVVTALPPLLAGRDREGLVLDVLREAGEWEGSVPDPRREIVARLACRAAVKAWERYPGAQGETLLADLYACREPGFCPHGRPTVLTFGWKELEKRFGRSG
ncbi:MAG TPA: DNA mismatch repair endonuclease MutL, partial [bacterium]|nr:DNA mismatch repair endonuclease MutL [bacterium]